ncbi:LysR family transcriptional regulator (plasmid) [Deinococcus taeanensis]|uniref:LysR family transcriptional regulator n=1 Tax=Deinococcus taeanensis TaxID=2737050 RepID=UPI001CDCC593|nr:LysR family transcriptional regulator [Deinococcus taeanensis]UBV44144.1 LysR family transcriptional regulator [Deinococcus taeanensis]
MRINPDFLVTFNAVAEFGSVSKAAEYLHLSQPAVSGQLRSLAELVGAPLYTRRARGIALTAEGRELLPHAQAIARSMKRVTDLAGEHRDRRRSHVRLGASWTLSVRAVTLAGQFQSGVPTVSLHSGHTPHLIARVAAGELDAALTVDASQALPEGLEARRFSSEDLRLIVPPGHPLASEGYVTPGVLARETLLQPMPESGVRKRAAKLLDGAGVMPRHVLELGGFLAVKAALHAGLGVAILPRSLVGPEVDHGLLVSLGLEAPEVTLGYHVVSAPQALLPTAVAEVLSTLT